MKQGKQEWGKRAICKGQEDHDMETDINETESAGMKDETRGTGMNGGGVRDMTEIERT